MTAGAPPRPSEPIQRLPIEVKTLRWGLFALTILSAAAALFAEPLLANAVERGDIDSAWLFIPLACFVVFLTVYAVDRWFLVRRRSYPPGRAFFQIVFGLLFALLLLPSTLDDWRRPDAVAAVTGVARLVAHPDPEVRAVTVEALGFRGVTDAHLRWVLERTGDRDERVRKAALAVLGRWSGRVGDEPHALEAWARARLEGSIDLGAP